MIYAPVGWALRKDSELEDLFDYHLLRMVEFGIVKPVEKYDMDIKTYNEKTYSTVKTSDGLGYEDLAFPFEILMLGFIIALAQLGIEAIKSRTTDKRKPTRKRSVWAVRLRSQERNPKW